MPAHLPGERRAALLEFVLDERMPGLAHRGDAACGLNRARQNLRAFDIVDNLRAGLGFQNALGEQQHQAVGPNDIAVGRDHPEAVAVAVERQAEIGLALRHRGD